MTSFPEAATDRPTLQDMPRHVLDLAVTLSTAIRIEPALLRSMRLAVRPALDVGAESDLWFGPWAVHAAGEYMVFHPDLLAPLRDRLRQELERAAPDDPLLRCDEVIDAAHQAIAPILGLEEKVTWVAVPAEAGRPVPDATIEDLLGPALLAAQEQPERRPGLLRWLTGARHRLPVAVRASLTLQQLRTLLEEHERPTGSATDDQRTGPWPPGPPTYVLPVRHDGSHITLGDPTWPAAGIRVPDTQPLQLQVSGADSWEEDVPFISLRKGNILTVPVSHVPVFLRTAHGTVYRLGAAGTGPELSTRSAPDLLIGTAIAQLTDRDAIVHGVKPVGSRIAGPTRLPGYVRRAVDAQLTAALDPAHTGNRIVIAEGEPGSGRTRALWEAVLRTLPSWWLWSPPQAPGRGDLAGTLETKPLGTPLVIWLDDLDAHLNAPDGARTAAALLRLLGDTQRGPVLIAATRDPAAPALREASARELVRAATTVSVPPGFSAGELHRATARTGSDPQLRGFLDAVVSQGHGRLVQRGGTGSGRSGTSAPIPLPPLPPLPSGFTGREHQLTELLDVLTDSRPDRHRVAAVVRIVGMPGIGKTTLAFAAASRLDALGYFPGGIVHAHLTDGDARDSLTQYMRVLGAAPDKIPRSPGARRDLYQSLLAARTAVAGPVLVVADDLPDSDAVHDLMPRSVGGAMLYTARLQHLVPPEAQQVSLDVLTPEESVALVAHTLAQVLPSDTRVMDEPEAAQELAALCGHLPLALSIAAALLVRDRRTPISTLVQELRSQDLTAFEEGGRAVRSALDASYSRLPPAQARTLRQLAANPGPDISTEAALHLLRPRYGSRTALVQLRALAQAGLVRRTDGDDGERWAMHTLVRRYAQQVGTDESEQRAALLHLVEHYVGRLVQADARLRARTPANDGNQVDSTRWLEAERTNLVAVAHEAHRQHLYRAVIDIAAGLAEHLTTTQRFDELEQLAALAVTAAEVVDDAAALTGALNNQAVALHGTGHSEQALTLFRRASLTHGTGSRHHAQVISNIGASLLEAQRFDEALAAFDQAIAYLGDASASPRAFGRILGNRAHTLLQLHRYDDAVHSYEVTVDLAGRDESRVVDLALALTGLGGAYRAAQRTDEAVGALQRAADLFRSVNARTGLALALSNLGDTYRQAGRPSEAVAALEGALAALNDPAGTRTHGQVLTSLAAAFMETGRFEEATQRLEQAADLHTRLGDTQQLAHTLNNLGLARFEIGGMSDAIRYLHRARELHQAAANLAGEAEVLFNIGNLSTRSQQYEQALEALWQALSLFRDTRDPRGQAQTRNSLGIALLESGRFRDAVQELEESAGLFTTLGDQHATAQALNNLGNALSSLGDNSRAVEVLQRAVLMLTEIKDSPRLAQTLANLALAQLREGRTGRALATMVQAERLFLELGDARNTRLVRSLRDAALRRPR
ncbi:tetratricopeptide repeat protein [Kitasatospora sp. NPDC001664]